MALAAVLFLAATFSLERRDDGWLLLAAGQPLDVRGSAASAWVRLTRDCKGVRRVAADQVEHERAAGALRGYSPPDSASAQVLQMLAMGPWRLVEARFDTLPPVVVVIVDAAFDGDSFASAHLQLEQAASVGRSVSVQAVWSGTTRPWDAAWRIRRFLGQRLPALPRPLLACLDPSPVF